MPYITRFDKKLVYLLTSIKYNRHVCQQLSLKAYNKFICFTMLRIRGNGKLPVIHEDRLNEIFEFAIKSDLEFCVSEKYFQVSDTIKTDH